MADYESPLMATLSGIVNAFKKQKRIGTITDADSIQGKTCLITGSNSGLGFAVAIALAKRGGKIIMACRSGIPEAGEKVKVLSGSRTIRMLQVDLSDLDSIDQFIEQLKEDGIKIDILICNAATVPSMARKTPQGFETMFVVNYLAKFILLNRFWNEGIINRTENYLPRIIVISSESHRSPTGLNLETLGEFEEFPMSKVVSFYGYYKLALTTLVKEFSRRINKDKTNALVYSLCPGAVNTNIAKEAPQFTKPLLKIIFALFFRDPKKAAEPVVYLACSKEVESKPDLYLHMMTEKQVDENASNEENGKTLWNRSTELLQRINYAGNLS